MRRGVILALVLALPGAVAAEIALDPHLSFLPLGPDEQAKVASALVPPGDFAAAERFEANAGGGTTVAVSGGRDAFTRPAASLDAKGKLDFALGHALFGKLWIAAPASTKASDGLGPIYNARSCESCHIRDGRGHLPDGEAARVSLVLRLAVPGGPGPDGIADYLATLPDPVYGHQLQDFAAPGQMAEGQIAIRQETLPVTLGDGTTVTLLKPVFTVRDPAYGPLHPAVLLSPRIAPPMIGLGLLEAIPAADILAREDPGDADGDGISGRANIVIDPGTGQSVLGRFGLKAGKATIRDQTAQALLTDLGLSTPLRPAATGDCTPAQTACLAAPNGEDAGIRDGREVDQAALELLTYYAQSLAVPARRGVGDADVLRGKRLFHDLNCTGCHSPKHVTHRLTGTPALSFQLIWPYTDLLLHDMGERLADGLPEARATGREWRTPPLWGIGLAQAVSPEAGFLHDGRARTLLEAILWHGGEAEAQRDAVIALPAADRNALVAFLESL